MVVSYHAPQFPLTSHVDRFSGLRSHRFHNRIGVLHEPNPRLQVVRRDFLQHSRSAQVAGPVALPCNRVNTVSGHEGVVLLPSTYKHHKCRKQGRKSS